MVTVEANVLDIKEQMAAVHMYVQYVPKYVAMFDM